MVDRPTTLPALTGLRGVAALWVLAYHLTQGLDVPFARAGYLGVDLFFLLSGFVLCLIYADTGDLSSRPIYWRFLALRVARIWPLHLFALAMVGLLVLLFPGFHPAAFGRNGADLARGLLESLLLVQNWPFIQINNWNEPAWTISAEWMLYLLFPTFVLVTQKPASWRWAMLLATAFALLPRALLHLREDGARDFATNADMLRPMMDFAVGCLLYRGWKMGLPRLGGVWDLLAVALIGLGTSKPEWNVLAVFGFLLLVLLSAQGEGPIARLLATPIGIFLGDISYSLYLLHVTLLYLLRYLLQIDAAPLGWPVRMGWFAGFTAIAILAATASYRLVERPSRAYLRRLVSPRPAYANV